MNNDHSALNSKTAINKLKNLLNEYQGRPLDEALSRKIENVCLGISLGLETDLTHKNTEINKASEKIVERRQKGRRIYDNIVFTVEVGLSVVDDKAKVAWANNTICDWMDFKESPVGLRSHDFYHCNDVEREVCPFEEILKGEKCDLVETWIMRKSGKRMRIQHVATPIASENKDIEYALLLTIDVTEREKLVHRLLLLQKLGEVMQGTLHLDKLLHLILTCVTSGYAFEFNRALLFLVDKEQNVLKGKLAVGPSSQEEASRIWQELSEKHSSLKNMIDALDYSHNIDTPLNTMTKLRVYPLSGRKEIITTCVEEKRTIIISDATKDTRVTEEFRKGMGVNEFVCVPLTARNETIGVIVADNLYTGEPISEDMINTLTMFANQAALAIENAETYKRLENKMNQLTETQKRLIHSEKLAAIGSMSSYIAHEIRNPLVTIGGFAKTLSRFTFTDSRIKTNIDIIIEEVKRLEKILNNITDFSKPSTPEKTNVQICEIMESTCILMENYFQEKHINLHKEYETSMPRIFADPAQIKQVFINILMNAVESMPDGGNLDVKIKMANELIEIFVIDTGKGIPQEVLQNIYDPFFTVKPNGTGVGLSISLKIIEDHDGSINVESKQGKGTTITLTLPIK